MHLHTHHQWKHSHNFASDSDYGEKSTTKVMVLTAMMMVIEIVAGMMFGSMALLADGWHMATHVAAFGIALFAYRYARSHANNPRFTFGTGKVSVLGGFASAVALAVIALVMALESVMRMLAPQTIHFNEAILVALVGLLVNIVSGFLLQEHRDQEQEHQDEGHHHDHNLRAAYLHVLADALTSVFATVALGAGKYFGWVWLDPVMGLVGAAVITRWSYGLARDTSLILLDGAVNEQEQSAIIKAIERDTDTRITDLHVWRVSPRHYSASVSVVTHQPKAPEHYKHLLRDIPHLAHVLIEVDQCHEKFRGENAASHRCLGVTDS
ncbi:MAG: CDF family Co(II)/Ni(II) efflux transporter DmeF [Deltaproteobacteria bacterium]|nr:CDF family Co(II)/Ni(II) efflux transporter DmeF [Deltaproteobacteria bacterium]